MPLHVSAPLVAFRESVFHPAEATEVAVKRPQVGLRPCSSIAPDHACDADVIRWTHNITAPAGSHALLTCMLHLLHAPAHSPRPAKALPARCAHERRSWPSAAAALGCGLTSCSGHAGPPSDGSLHPQGAEHATSAQLVVTLCRWWRASQLMGGVWCVSRPGPCRLLWLPCWTTTTTSCARLPRLGLRASRSLRWGWGIRASAGRASAAGCAACGDRVRWKARCALVWEGLGGSVHAASVSLQHLAWQLHA